MPQTRNETRTPSPVRGTHECPGAPKRTRRIRPVPVSARVSRSLLSELETVAAAAGVAGEAEA